MGNKQRHIAITVRDPEAAAKFFERAFGMTRAVSLGLDLVGSTAEQFAAL